MLFSFIFFFVSAVHQTQACSSGRPSGTQQTIWCAHTAHQGDLAHLANGPSCPGRVCTAETLKYLYLLFSPRAHLPPEAFVLNTEAHPLRISAPAHAPSLPQGVEGPSAVLAGAFMPAEGGLGVI